MHTMVWSIFKTLSNQYLDRCLNYINIYIYICLKVWTILKANQRKTNISAECMFELMCRLHGN